MYSNLVKGRYTVVPAEDSIRVIDSNERMRRRLEEIALTMPQGDGEGFVAGLAAEYVEVLPEDGEYSEEGVAPAALSSADAETIIANANAEAQNIIENAKAEAEQILAAARIRGENEKTQILAQAREQGYHEGALRAQEQAELIEREYREQVAALEASFQQQIDVLEPQFVDTITDIYEHIFHVELDSYREILTHLITGTIRKLEGGRDFLVHVSKEDYPYVSMQKKQMLSQLGANCNVDVVEDMTLDKNQCMIETENGIYDCGLGTQMAELKRKLMLLAWSKEN